jgi:hypothetical protein
MELEEALAWLRKQIQRMRKQEAQAEPTGAPDHNVELRSCQKLETSGEQEAAA